MSPASRAALIEALVSALTAAVLVTAPMWWPLLAGEVRRRRQVTAVRAGLDELDVSEFRRSIPHDGVDQAAAENWGDGW
jgi:hypothetical protein